MAGKIQRHPSLAFLDGRYVNVTGDTMTGDLTIGALTIDVATGGITTTGLGSLDKLHLTGVIDSEYDNITIDNDEFTIKGTDAAATYFDVYLMAPEDTGMWFSLIADGMPTGTWQPQMSWYADFDNDLNQFYSSKPYHFKIIDQSDYILFTAASDIPEMTTIGSCDLKINASSGEVTSTSNWTTTGTLGAGDITILDPTPILVFQDSDSAGAASVGFIEWKDSGGGRAGFFGNNSSGNDDLYWKNEQGGNIGIETTGAGNLNIIATLAQFNATPITTTGTLTADQINSDSYYANDGVTLWGSTDGITFTFNMDASTGGSFSSFDILADNYYNQNGNNQWGSTDGLGNFDVVGDFTAGTIVSDGLVGGSTGQFGVLNSIVPSNLAIDLDNRYLYADDATDIILDFGTAGTADFGDSIITTTSGDIKTATGNLIADQWRGVLDADERIEFSNLGGIKFFGNGVNVFQFDATGKNNQLTFNTDLTAIDMAFNTDTITDFMKIDSGNNTLDIGDGGVTNYSQFSANGIRTMYGTARVKRSIPIDNANLGKGSTAPSQIIIGNYNSWEYTINDDTVFTFHLPHDWASGTDVLIQIDWYINEAGGDEIKWRIDWAATPHNSTEAIDAPTHTGNSNTGDIVVPATAKFLTANTLTISGGSLAVEDQLGIKVSRVAITDGTNPGNDPAIVDIHIVYTADKLGEAT